MEQAHHPEAGEARTWKAGNLRSENEDENMVER